MVTQPAVDRTVANMDLVGGRPVVDFVNTVSDRASARPHDRLRTFGDLLEWCVRVGLVEPAEAERLAAAAVERPSDGEKALLRARELREALFDLFTAKIEDRTPPPAALEVVNSLLAEGMGHRRLEPGGDGLGWAWGAPAGRLDRVLWPLAWSAAELLTSAELERLKRCGQDDCRWIFLDLSKNRSRRWCTMEDCGNRAKARRHYHRHRGVD